MKKIIVIGGGPAGMIAANTAAERGNKVILCEKNEKLGKKLYITGKGRCNLTNDCDEEVFLSNVHGNPYFLYSAIYNYNSKYIMDYFENSGVPLKVERGQRVFPVSEKASDITKALERNLRKSGVAIRLNSKINSIHAESGEVKGVYLENSEYIAADAVIIATGGISYPVTGSDGDGYRFSRELGHLVTEVYPSLVSLNSPDKFIAELAGLSLKNVMVSLVCGKKIVYKNFGEMLFTHSGVSGPVILTASRFVTDSDKNFKLLIDFKPALDEKELDSRILSDFKENVNKDFKNSLDKLFPQKIIPVIVEKSGINPDKKVNEINKKERRTLLEVIKNFDINIKGTGGFDEAVVTAGGVSVDEINPSTMESKLVKGLFFAGEVIDVDGYTGGFNLQIAFSTGLLAGNSV